MLSILIPIYNYNINRLVEDLNSQCSALNINYEIFLMDDNSQPMFQEVNKEVTKFPRVHYEVLTENVGRAVIRNKLAEAADYNTFIFLDCDISIIEPNFVKNYLDASFESDVVVGGLTYSEEPPPSQLFFRWYYGRKREVNSAAKRNKNPFKGFNTMSFCIQKSVFQAIKFDADIYQYGHEDTLFGLELGRKGHSILHIDNPIQHDGLDTFDDFIDKTHKSLETLLQLHNQEKGIETRLLKTFNRLNKPGMKKGLLRIFAPRKKQLLRKLRGGNPDLRLFDFYKLGQLVSIDVNGHVL